MTRNPKYGVPNYQGGPGLGSLIPLSAARFSDGTKDRVYWAGDQNLSHRAAEGMIDTESLSDDKYQAPSNWPVVHRGIAPPKVVLYKGPTTVIFPFPSFTRGNFWLNFGTLLKTKLEGDYPDQVYVIPLDQGIIDGSQILFNGGGGEAWDARFIAWFTPIAADVAAAQYLGGDVLCLFIEQEFGFTSYSGNFADFDDTFGDVTNATNWWRDDYDLLSQARDVFRRHAGWLYHDEGAIDPGVEHGYLSPVVGGPGGFVNQTNFDKLNQWWRGTLRLEMMEGTDIYSGRGLADLDWTYKGEVDFNTISVDDLAAEIAAYFELISP